MIFDSLENEVMSRIRECSVLIEHARKTSNAVRDAGKSDGDHYIKVQKGLLFVSMYAVIEYTVLNSCQLFLSFLSQDPKEPIRYKEKLICVLLSKKFDAVVNTGKKRVWHKKKELVESIFHTESVDIVDTAIPTDGTNISISQLKDVWDFFCLPDPMLPEKVKSFLLEEIKENRNAISHGRKTPSEVGARYTLDDLEVKFDSVKYLALHIINVFKCHAENGSFLKEGA